MRTRLWAAAIAVALAACGGKGKTDTTTPPEGDGTAQTAPTESLYTRLGGKEGITKVVDMFVANVAADTRVNAFFANTEIDKFKALLVDQICDAASGGTECKYTGKGMVEAHKGMNITQAQFDAVVEDLVKALDDAGVGETEKNELLAVLGPMAPEIVGQ
jgi:hemoglobin